MTVPLSVSTLQDTAHGQEEQQVGVHQQGIKSFNTTSTEQPARPTVTESHSKPLHCT
jgi:hypothetical protein